MLTLPTLKPQGFTPLIDADLLCYEVGFGSQQTKGGVVVANSFDHAADLLNRRIELICDEVEATFPPILYLTSSPFLTSTLNRMRKCRNEELLEYVPNFRHMAAFQKGYKANRTTPKPLHLENIQVYMLTNYDCIVSQYGMEADDELCITQNYGDGTSIICSRDKDLKQCPGWHYSWELGKQPSVMPFKVEPLGELILTPRHKHPETGKVVAASLFGTGDKWFYAQLIIGDTVDNIGGIKGRGPVMAYDLLNDAENSFECYKRVREVYEDMFKDKWKLYFREQADLLWMIRELDEKGQPVKWRPPSLK